MSLPGRWVTTSVGVIASVSGGVTKNAGRETSQRLPYLRVANVYADELRLDDIAEIGVTATDVERALLRTGDLLVVEGNGSVDQIGRVAVWRGAIAPCVHQNHLIKVRFERGISEDFVKYWLLSPRGREAIVASASSTSGLHTLSISKVDDLPVLVAPEYEQLRVVSTLDSLLSRLDAAVASLTSGQRKLKAYRASVLKAAVEGRLVPTEAELARQEGRPYEPADVLVERILKERRRRWEEAELAKMKAAGKVPKDDKWKAQYSEPEPPDVDSLPTLPEGWRWATVSSLYWDGGYGTSVKCTDDGTGPAVLRIPNIVAGRVELDHLKFAAHDAVIQPDGRVRPGDFLFIRTNGSRSLIGRGALALHEHHAPLFFASYLIRLRLMTTEACDRWFALAWGGPSVRNQVLRVAASSAGQHNISLSAASSFVVPMPPAAEQARIIEEFERLDSSAAVLEQEIAGAVGRSSRLRQAVLKWAFEGRLVDQDSADESAEVLLTRIRAERAASAPASPESRRSRMPRVAS